MKQSLERPWKDIARYLSSPSLEPKPGELAEVSLEEEFED